VLVATSVGALIPFPWVNPWVALPSRRWLYARVRRVAYHDRWTLMSCSDTNGNPARAHPEPQHPERRCTCSPPQPRARSTAVQRGLCPRGSRSTPPRLAPTRQRPHRWRGERARALWKGPMRCTPAYDLKFSSSRCVITRRGLPSVRSAIPVDQFFDHLQG
jgi:hypothetical protein